MTLLIATDVPTVAGILAGVAALAGVAGYLVGRWWALLVPCGIAIVLAMLLVTSPKEEGSLALLWWILLFPTAVAFVAMAIGIALRRLNASRGSS